MPDDSSARNPLGPVGRTLIENLKELREQRRLGYTELHDRLLQETGRDIPVLGLSRIEKGRRRVDVDDLVALAIALRVNPAALLLPRDRGEEDDVELTPAVRHSMARAWRWMDGQGPLPDKDGRVSWQEIADFAAHSRPKNAPLPQAVQELIERYGEPGEPDA